MTSSDLRQLGADCGGRWLLDRTSMLAISPFVVVSSVLSQGPESTGTTMGWVVANVIALVVTWLAAELVRATVIRHRSITPVPVVWVVVIGAALGVVKGVATAASGWALGLATDPAMVVDARWINTAVLGALVVPAMAVMLAVLERFRVERRLLIDERVHAAITGSSPDHTDNPDDNQLAAFVHQARVDLASADVDRYAPVVRDIVDGRLRPLSQQILQREEESVTDFTFANLAALALTHGPFPAVPVAIMFAVTGFPLLAGQVGGGEALARAAVTAVVILVVYRLAQLVRPTHTLLAGMYMVAVVGFTAWAQIAVGDAVFSPIEANESIGFTVMVFVWLGQLTLATAIISATRWSHDAVRAELVMALGPDGLNEAVKLGRHTLERQDLAFYLHSQVQNQLVSAAARIEHLGDDHDAVRRELDAIDQLLDAAMGTASHAANADANAKTDAGTDAGTNNPASPGSPPQLADRLAAIVERWRGFVDITVAVDAVDVPPGVGDQVERVVAEAVTNAVRHGLAVTVAVTVTTDASTGDCTVTAIDDGVGPRNGRPGTGLHYFRVVSAGQWTLAPSPQGGSRLTVPIAPAVPATRSVGDRLR